LAVLEKLNHPIHAAFLIAPSPGIENDFVPRMLTFIDYPFDWKLITSHVNNSTFFQSDNDPYISMANAKKLSKQLARHFM